MGIHLPDIMIQRRYLNSSGNEPKLSKVNRQAHHPMSEEVREGHGEGQELEGGDCLGLEAPQQGHQQHFQQQRQRAAILHSCHLPPP